MMYRQQDGSDPYPPPTFDPANPIFTTMGTAVPNITLCFETGGMGTISGSVTAGGNPLPGVRIEVDGTNRFTYTAENGQYEIPYLMPDTYSLTAIKIGYEICNITGLVVIAEETTTQDIEMTMFSTVNITGIVLCSDNNYPASGASIRLTGYAGSGPFTADYDGNFTIPGVFVNNDYNLVINYAHYMETNIPIQVGDSNIDLGIVYVNEVMLPPGNVQNDNDGLNAYIEWLAPGYDPPPPPTTWFSHSTAENITNAIGTGGAADFISAQRFTSDQLAIFGVSGADLLSVRFFPFSGNIPVVWINVDIMIYTGGSTSPWNSGTLVHSQPVYPGQLVENEWNIVDLSSPVTIPVGEELWIGIRYNVGAGHPSGCDGGPPINGFGNMIYVYGTWHTLLDIDPVLTYNWAIQGLSISEWGTPITVGPINYTIEDHLGIGFYSQPRIVTIDSQALPVFEAVSTDLNFPATSTNRAFEGLYNIYRFNTDDQLNPALWTTITTNWAETTYTDPTWQNLNGGTYRYAVTAIYTNNNESEPAIGNPPMLKVSTVTITGTITGNDTEGAGIPNVIINLTGYENYDGIVTNNLGAYTIPNVYANFTYTISASHSLYQNFVDEAVVVGNADLVYNFEMSEKTPPVRHVNVTIEEQNAIITWDPPGQGEDVWFSHSWQDEIVNGVGTGGEADFITAQRFTPLQLEEMGVADATLARVMFFPFEGNTPVTWINVDIHIYIGGSAAPNNPGTLVYTQTVYPGTINVNVWNNVELTNPVPIPTDQELWIGIRYNVASGHPAGADDGPGFNGYGNMFYAYGSWNHIDPGLHSYNWAIRGMAESVGNAFIRSASGKMNKQRNDVMFSPFLFPEAERINAFPTDGAKDTRSLTGYQIMRTTQANENNPETWELIATDLDIEHYIDPSWATIPNDIYKYIVYAIYTDGVLSEPRFSSWLTPIVGTNDTYIDIPAVTALKTNYPNPFNPSTIIVFDKATDGIVLIDIYNIKGQKVKTLINDMFKAGRHTVIWNGIDDNNNSVGSGVYFYKMTTEEHISTKKMLLMK